MDLGNDSDLVDHALLNAEFISMVLEEELVSG